MKHPERSLLFVAVVCLTLFGVALGHVLLAACGCAVLAAGCALRQQQENRVAGNVLLWVGMFGLASVLLLGTGYRLGKDMAHRDSVRSASAVHAAKA